MSERPVVKHDMLNTLLREEKITEANELLASGFEADLSDTDFRALHLCGLNTQNLDFSNSYFRLADLRGLDFRTCNLEGASLHAAHITGCYFPKTLSAEEIKMSVKYGTRMRYL
ncbi:MAG: pentapeptide repeat-containing protein [Mariprofundaceae bacterium]